MQGNTRQNRAVVDEFIFSARISKHLNENIDNKYELRRNTQRISLTLLCRSLHIEENLHCFLQLGGIRTRPHTAHSR